MLPVIHTPLIQEGVWADDIKLWVKDESRCPTRTFKDRLAWEYVQAARNGLVPSDSKTVIASITLGNTMCSFGRAFAEVAKGKTMPQLFAIFPQGYSNRIIGPNSKGQICSGHAILKNLEDSNVNCIQLDLATGFLSEEKIKLLVTQHFGHELNIFNVTNGIRIPAYKQILIESLAAMDTPPDYITVPVGAGVLFEECVQVILDQRLKTHVIGVSVTNPNSIADKIYGLYSPFYAALARDGVFQYRNDHRFTVRRVTDDQIRAIMKMELPAGFEYSEPSALASLIPLIEQRAIMRNRRVLAINTGDGIVGNVI